MLIGKIAALSTCDHHPLPGDRKLRKAIPLDRNIFTKILLGTTNLHGTIVISITPVPRECIYNGA
jgi:hypothetical protein